VDPATADEALTETATLE